MKDVPGDYYRRLHEAEQRHWWAQGMRGISGALLGARLAGDLLDAGCGTGGFLAWAAPRLPAGRLCGVDISAEAVEVARRLVPRAELHVAPVDRQPWADASFDVAVLNDVLQHVHEDLLAPSLHELRRVLRPGGALLVRTGGARHGLRGRPDWRSYDAAGLAAELRRGGFRVERLTYANAVLSLLHPEPKPPSEATCGIPALPGPVATAVGGALLALEARWLRRPGASLPRGHTLLALATPLPA